MCGVNAEDAGEIHFVARDVESTAYLEVEGQSTVQLRSAVLFLKGSATLSCPRLRAPRLHREAAA